MIPNQTPNGTLRYRVEQAEKDIDKVNLRIDGLEGKLNLIILAVVGLALSIAGSAVIFALTVQSLK